MKVIDVNRNVIENPDYSKGYIEPGKVTPDEFGVCEYGKGHYEQDGEFHKTFVVDEVVYFEYSEEELAVKSKAEAEAAFLSDAPDRMESLETDVIDHDEAITGLYESMTQAQLDTDEALVSVYEMLNGGITNE